MHSVDSNIPTLPASATWMHNREQGPPPVEDPGPAASPAPGPCSVARQ
jgi:hypothetical protein